MDHIRSSPQTLVWLIPASLDRTVWQHDAKIVTQTVAGYDHLNHDAR